MFKKYNPKKIVGSWNGVPFVGFMDGTFITVEADEDAVTKTIGSQGDATATLNPNKGCSLVATFIQGSPVNDALSALTPDPRRDFLPTGVLLLTDLNGTTYFQAKDAWIKKVAKIEYGDKAVGREWTFDCAEADIHNVGGNVS